MELPRLLADFEPLPGVIKEDYADFEVEEIPLYPADGVGSHTYFLVEKAGLSTHQAVNDLARALGVRRRDIGYAGMKDARAVARQWFSVEHVEPGRVRTLALPRLRVLEVTRHRNKLRLGHLRGNRFRIRIRRSDLQRAGALKEALEILERRGVPNYFGPQRFGARGDSWRIGRALLRQDVEAAVDQILGRPGPLDEGRIRKARELYERQDYEQAWRHWPGMYRDERRALRALARSNGNKRRALGAIDKAMRRFYVSAYQSYLFNLVVARRLPEGLDRIWKGDLAWLHGREAVFLVEDAGVEQPRVEAFEISPSGPLFGYRMTEPGGRAGELERAVLAEEDLTREAFRSGPLRVKGARRPLRFRPGETDIELGADAGGPYLELRFALPKGCYATALLRELFHEANLGGAAAGPRGAETPVEE